MSWKYHTDFGTSTRIFDDLHKISGNLKNFEGLEINLINFNWILIEFNEMYITLT
jgi:hypothetical protein